jgi:hypothetical protein
MQKIIVVPGVQHRFQKHTHDLSMPHAAKTPVRVKAISLHAPYL